MTEQSGANAGQRVHYSLHGYVVLEVKASYDAIFICVMGLRRKTSRETAHMATAKIVCLCGVGRLAAARPADDVPGKHSVTFRPGARRGSWFPLILERSDCCRASHGI